MTTFRHRAINGGPGALVASAVCAVLLGACSPRPPPAPPNVILIGLDTVRADHLSCYSTNFCSTPRLDRLAANSVQFQWCFSPVPMTLPSFTSAMSGRHAKAHRVPCNGFVVSSNVVMLAECFQDAGYATAGFLGSYVLQSSFHFNQGFEYYDEVDTSEEKFLQRSAEGVNEAVFRWLDRCDARPAFLFIHYFDAHVPFYPPPPYAIPAPPGCPKWSLENIRSLRSRMATNATPETMEQFRHAVASYGAEVRHVDEQVGRLLDRLGEKGILSNAVVVVWSDHGLALADHMETAFGYTREVYDSSIRVPLLISAPGIRSRQVTALTSLIDIAPTICELARLPAVPAHEGKSLVRAMKGRERSVHDRIFSEAAKSELPGSDDDPRWINRLKKKCVRTRDWKLILNPLSDSRWQAFHVSADAGEQHNLIGRQEGASASFVRDETPVLQDWMDDIEDVKSSIYSVDPDTKRRLRSLGYVR